MQSENDIKFIAKERAGASQFRIFHVNLKEIFFLGEILSNKQCPNIFLCGLQPPAPPPDPRHCTPHSFGLRTLVGTGWRSTVFKGIFSGGFFPGGFFSGGILSGYPLAGLVTLADSLNYVNCLGLLAALRAICDSDLNRGVFYCGVSGKSNIFVSVLFCLF